MDQKDPTSSTLTQEVKWELEVPGSAAVGRGETEARTVAPRRVCACRNTAQGSQSCSLGGNEKKSKAAQKAEGNPADEEQPLMGPSWQVYFSSTGHLFSMACAPYT